MAKCLTFCVPIAYPQVERRYADLKIRERNHLPCFLAFGIVPRGALAHPFW
jgi:hypothetical protein